jgi:hypothetical protein
MSVEWLNGKVCSRVYKHYAENFTFELGPAALSIACLWRVVVVGRVVLTSRDHGQQFGLPAPVDAYEEAFARLRGRPLVGVQLDETSADLILEFEDGQRLELRTGSSGFELPTTIRTFVAMAMLAMWMPASAQRPAIERWAVIIGVGA